MEKRIIELYRRKFDDIKEEKGVEFDTDLTADDLKEVVAIYKEEYKKHAGVEHKMKQVSKTAIRKEFLKDLGLALWLERRSRRLSIKKVEKKAGVPSWIIDRIERGLCADIFKLFRLCGYYGRKIRVKLEE